MRWRILVSAKEDPAYNMAVDEAILSGVSEGRSQATIRFYDWDPPTVSCGYNQFIEKEVDLDLVRSMGYGFVRRPTGGRVVLHNNEITYAVIVPATDRFEGGVTASYAEISKALATGLEMMGIEVEFERGSLEPGHQRQTSNPCFSSSSRYELLVDGKKIIGSAQVRRDNTLLQHGSILLHFDQSDAAFIVPGLSREKREKLAGFLARKTVAINQLLPEPLSYRNAVDFLKKGFQSAWKQDQFFEDADLQGFEIKRVKDLVQTKYLTDDWNMRK